MNNCDLEKFSVPGVKLEPSFRPDITSYKATVASQLGRIRVDVCPSDTGACYTMMGGDGSKVITLKDGLNTVIVEVTAEDGTVKKYVLEVTKLSASHASLQGIKLSEDLQLVPSFASDVYEYSCTVPYYLSNISIHPSVQDNNMQVTVNGNDNIKPVSAAIGDTFVEVQVTSADGTKSQVYCIIVTRTQLPCCVSFTDVQDQMKYECPISLTSFYRPISIKRSDPKHTISGPYMDLLTRRSKTDPLDETLLNENWRLPEYELDMKMSAANIYCSYAYRGCGSILKLSEFGHHLRSCSFKPSNELDTKAVTETEWYKEGCTSTRNTELYLKHTIQEQSWEKRLQQVFGDSQIDKLCSHAETLICLYKQNLPKPGDVLHYEEGMSPLDALHQAAIAYASAIKLKPRDPNFHFQLGVVLEEHYYAAEIYGLKKKNEEEVPGACSAKATGKDEEIQAICKLHGFSGRPSIEQQLKALDLEYHQLKDQGHSSRADYIQNLYAWKSKQAGKVTALSLDEESRLTQAFMKYQDALSLNPDNWQYNFNVGRLLLLQQKNKEALMFLQNALALLPASAITRCYAGLALIEQDDGPGTRTQESVLCLHQGLEQLLSELLMSPECPSILQTANPLSLLNAQLLRGFLKLGKLLKKLPIQPTRCIRTSQQVLHIVADWSAKALYQCPHRGEVTRELEWVLLEAGVGLLESLVQDSSDREEWIRRRCQALSALIRLTSIPECQELLNMQEKICKLSVTASPCNSYSLYLLGVAQLAQYDNNSSTEGGQLSLQDAKLSFTASVRLENMPTKGPLTPELTNQKWWQDWKAAEDVKTEKQSNQAHEAGKTVSSAAVSVRGIAQGRGTPPISRGAKTPSKASPSSNKAVTTGGSNTKTVSTSVVRGRGATGSSSSKTGIVGTSKPKASSNPLISAKPQLSSAEKPPDSMSEAKPVPVQEVASGPVFINHSSYLHRLGLARALSRTKETAADASVLYQEVIKMAPEVHDAYIELADLLFNTDPLAALEAYCQYPQKPVEKQSFDDGFIPGEIIRLLIKYEKYDDPRLPVNMISYGKVMGIGCLEKYITILEEKFKTSILKIVYAGIHNKSVDDKDLQNFFRFKCWI